LLVRLGLRAGEVAAGTLTDLHWHAGEIIVRGKGRTEERLPLPADVGEALVAYLCRSCARSRRASRHAGGGSPPLWGTQPQPRCRPNQQISLASQMLAV